MAFPPKKLGVYIATHNNPMFLRLALLQLEAQGRKPDVLAIHENGHDEQWGRTLNADVLERLRIAGVEQHYDHNPAGMSHPFFHYLPLKRLVEAGCDTFTKWDHDDIFLEDHLWQLEWHLQGAFDMTPKKWVGNRRANILVLREPAYLFKYDREFTWNPLGGMSDTFMFDRDVAVAYLEDMASRAGTKEADDWVLHKYTLPKFEGQGVMLNSKPTTCYVAHGRNDSTRHWMQKPPDDLL